MIEDFKLIMKLQKLKNKEKSFIKKFKEMII
jgi:hypothetical protein